MSAPEGSADPAEVARALGAVLDGVTGASDVVSDPVHVAYLRGAADALAMVAQGERPDVNESGRDERDGPGGA